ncbi:hypothetical protein VNO78_22704 [Psophocarpus tetragonolobus]|uniref:Uncharacterized protein n=1 Tax=Psophocarpus tetragonolobus TaxID=3891 RepID=A0AAN9S2S4_PSOTE
MASSTTNISTSSTFMQAFSPHYQVSRLRTTDGMAWLESHESVLMASVDDTMKLWTLDTPRASTPLRSMPTTFTPPFGTPVVSMFLLWPPTTAPSTSRNFASLVPP